MKSNSYLSFFKGSFWILLVFIFALGNKGKAQSASTYVFSASSGTFSYLSGGTSVSILSDDATSSAIPIGFTFNYCGTGYSQLKACSNGWLTFNTGVTSSAWSNSLTNMNTIKPALMPWFDDMEGYFGTASYATTGAVGSRVFTFEYKNWDIDWSYDYNISIQVKLYEATGVIQYIYKQESGYYGGYESGTIGIGDGAATPTYLTLNGTGTSPTASSTTFTTSLYGRPASGQIYQFAPPVFCTGTPIAGATVATPSSVCLGATTTLTLPTATTGAGISYQWQSSPDGIVAYTNITGATSSTYSVTPTASTYYRCVVTCSAGPTSVNSTPVQVNFSYNVLSSSGGVRCGTGTTTLSATGTTGTTMRWYTAATGGSPIGSGSPFTTPSISSTTTYYVASETSASGVGQIGTGTSLTLSYGYPTAFGNYWYQDWQQIVYTAAELNAAGIGAGNITALAMNISGLPSPGSVSGYSIRIGATSASTLSAFTTSGFTTVFGPSTVSPSAGWNTITFSTPFNWDGTSNIIVDIRGDGAYGSANATTQYTTTSGNTCVYAYSYSSLGSSYYTSSPTPTTTNQRPNIRFTGNTVCSSPRVAVTATVNTPPTFTITGSQTVCNNTVATLSVTSTLSSYNTYSWSPATNLFTDAACTTPYTAGSSASTVYFKSTTAGTTTYTCSANNTTSLCASTATSSVTNLPSSIAAIATPSTLCVSGNTKLELNPATGYGAAQFQWQSSPNNSTWTDSSGMTGMVLNTATLSNTRYYRVVLRNSSGSFCLNSTSDTALVLKPSVVSVANAVRCAPGSVTLGATASDGTINWFDASTGGSSLGTGTSFTTPSLASTTTYYAEVRATPDISATIGTAGTTIGTSTGGTGLTPFAQYYESARTQYLITAADITASGLTAGSFASMAFNVTTKNSSASFVGYTIRLANTTATSLASGFISPTFTTVYGPSNYTTASGSNVFPLSGGFTWDGTSNVLVQVCFSNATGSYDGYTLNDIVSGTSKTYTCTYGLYEDNAYLCAGSGSYPSYTSSSVLPDITFTRQGCVSSRSPVVATINPLPVPTISPATGPVQICDGNVATFTAGGGGNYQWRDASGHISGATGSTFSTGTAGSYRVVVTNPTTGCKDSSVAVAVNVNPVPTVSIAPAGTRSICADSAQKFTSVITGSGLTYQWFNGATPITGATKDTFSASVAGNYTLRVYLGTCSDTSNVATLIVNPLPASSFTKTGTTGAICVGSTFELTALSIPASSTYQWSLDGVDIPGANSQIFNATKGGVYTVRIKDANNCRKTSDTISLINTPMGVPKLTPKDLRFCEGTEVMLYANAGPYAVKYAWVKDGSSLPDTTATIVTGTIGTYEVTVTDVFGCTVNSTKSTVTVDPLPTKPVIIKTGMMLSTADPYTTYQWYRNGKVIPGATMRNYTMMYDGNYYVVVTNNVKCINQSDIFSVQGLSVKQIVRDEINIDVYPNPSQNIINIVAPIEVNLSIKDIQGKQILELKNAKQVDMAAYADGMYIFTITDKEGMVVKMDKVVKKTN